MKRKDKAFARDLASCVNTTPSLINDVFQCPITPANPTNGDRIRAMSDEELAEFLIKLNDRRSFYGLILDMPETKGLSYNDEIRRWLNAESK